jgi:large subunit ribosomal protein L5
MAYSPRLKDKYAAAVVPALQSKFGYSSSMQVPKLQKICLNQGIGDAVSDKKLIEGAIKEMTTISGQKAVATISKKEFRSELE